MSIFSAFINQIIIKNQEFCKYIHLFNITAKNLLCAVVMYIGQERECSYGVNTSPPVANKTNPRIKFIDNRVKVETKISKADYDTNLSSYKEKNSPPNGTQLNSLFGWVIFCGLQALFDYFRT